MLEVQIMPKKKSLSKFFKPQDARMQILEKRYRIGIVLVRLNSQPAFLLLAMTIERTLVDL